jgi:hypothetical protein
MMQDAQAKSNPGQPWQNDFNKKKIYFTSKFELILRKKLIKGYIWSTACTVLKLGHFGT